jgi:hypothetical protein
MGTQYARKIKFLSGPAIETVVYRKSYVAVSGELQAQNQSRSKPLLTDPQSHDYKTSNPRAAGGSPLGIKPRCNPKKKQLMKMEW